MAITPGVWAIDLGQCSLKALRVVERDGQLTATAFDFVEHPKQLSQHDADPDQLTREALEKFLSRNQLRGDVVAISVPGQSGLARFVKLPPVEEKKIGDIVKFEAKQQIPFNLDEVVWDYQRLSSGTVTGGFAMETEIGLFAMKRDAINHALQQFKEVGIEVNLIQMAPLSLCNFLAYDVLKKEANPVEEAPAPGAKRKCVVALDIGTDSSSLVITDGQKIIWQRPIPLGGTNFTRALVKELKLTFAKAEHLKRNATKSPDLKKILAALKPVLNDFVGEVQRSLSFFTNTHRDAEIDHVIGLGNAFKLPGLQRYMSEKLKLDVQKLDKVERVAGGDVLSAPAFRENILTFGVCCGLAVQGMERARLVTNLLPDEIRIERLVKAKKPWVAAAVATLLLGLGALAYGAGKQFIAYGDPRIAKTSADGKTVSANLDAEARKLDAAAAEAKKVKEEVESMAGGDTEQLNWIRLNKFVGEVVPRPEDCETPGFRDWRIAVQAKGGEPSAKDIDDYFNGAAKRTLDGKEYDWGNWRAQLPPIRKDDKQYLEEALKALWLRDKQIAGKDRAAVPGASTRAGVGGLIDFRIEGCNTRYTDDLSAFWEKLKAEKQGGLVQTEVRPSTDFGNPPSGKGWVVELRGYTYYNVDDEETTVRRFILDLLGARIAQAGTRTPAPFLGGGSVVASGATSGLGWYLPSPDTKAKKAETTVAEPLATDPAPADETKKTKAPPRPVSHVVLYVSGSLKTSNTKDFALIHSSMLDKIVVEAGKEKKGSPPTAVGAVGAGVSSGAAPEFESGATQGSGTTTKAAAVVDRSNFKPIVPGGGGSAGATKEPPRDDNAPFRTEFVLIFVWREPTPSSVTYKLPEAQSTSGTTSGEGNSGAVSGVEPPP